MRNIRLFWGLVKHFHFERFLILFIILYLIISGIIVAVEPGINTYGDALWYTFVASTSIGFGDYTAVTLPGRLLTVFITLYGILLAAILSGVVITHYLEVINRVEKLTATVFMDKLEHLSELSRQDIKDIEAKVRSFKANANRR